MGTGTVTRLYCARLLRSRRLRTSFDSGPALVRVSTGRAAASLRNSCHLPLAEHNSAQRSSPNRHQPCLPLFRAMDACQRRPLHAMGHTHCYVARAALWRLEASTADKQSNPSQLTWACLTVVRRQIKVTALLPERHHHASLLKSSIKQVACFGNWNQGGIPLQLSRLHFFASSMLS